MEQISQHPSFEHYIDISEKPVHGDVRSVRLYTVYHHSKTAEPQLKHELFLTDKQIIRMAEHLLRKVANSATSRDTLVTW